MSPGKRGPYHLKGDDHVTWEERTLSSGRRGISHLGDDLITWDDLTL